MPHLHLLGADESFGRRGSFAWLAALEENKVNRLGHDRLPLHDMIKISVPQDMQQ